MRGAIQKIGRAHRERHSPLLNADHDMADLRYCVVRNPFDRLISGWAYGQLTLLKNGMDWSEQGHSFRKWLVGQPWHIGSLGIDFKRESQHFWALKCNRVILFHELRNEWPRVQRELGIDDELPWENRTIGSRPPMEMFYDAETRMIVEDRFKWELDRWPVWNDWSLG